MRQFIVVLSVLCGGLLAGCGMTDPVTREGVWRPTGANDRNLRAMAASPADLARGVALRGGDGEVEAGAVDRLRAGKVKPLPDSGLAQIVPVQGGGAPSGGN